MTSPPTDARAELAALLEESAYHDYVYSYPHKTSYRPLAVRVPLEEVWADEDPARSFLYLHVPYCEMRCGFCNLFTAVDRGRGEAAPYLRALRRQAEVLADVVGPRAFAQVAVGGGTPTLLSAPELSDLFSIATDVLGADLERVPVSVETSPATADPDRIAVLADVGVDRVSIGIQSFDARHTAALKRPQDAAVRDAALRTLERACFTTFNIDLMYGIPGQTPDSIRADIARAIDAGANELYLYPLYVRALTPLGLKGGAPGERERCYAAAREALGARGWIQHSMRRFGAPASADPNAAPTGAEAATLATSPPRHRCQRDGMLGVGVGARSYTDRLHYSHDYAVAQPRIRGIIAEYNETPDEDFAVARHGVWLDANERRRRHLILTLLDGRADTAEYLERFGTTVEGDFPQLEALVELGLAERDASAWRLTAGGLAASDTIGHWLFSDAVRARMAAYEAR